MPFLAGEARTSLMIEIPVRDTRATLVCSNGLGSIRVASLRRRLLEFPSENFGEGGAQLRAIGCCSRVCCVCQRKARQQARDRQR